MPRQTITTTRADGTRSTYTLQPGSTVPIQLDALKPLKPTRIKADRRVYPKYKPGMSTAEYVALYQATNNSGMSCAEFWQPLNTAPAAGYAGIDTVERDIADELADTSADAALAVPMAAPAPAPVADAVPVSAPSAPDAAPDTLQSWQSAAARANVDPVRTAAEADSLADACADRFGTSDPAACVHLAGFADWHRTALAEIRGWSGPAAPAQQAPEPAPVAEPAPACAPAAVPRLTPAAPPAAAPTMPRRMPDAMAILADAVASSARPAPGPAPSDGAAQSAARLGAQHWRKGCAELADWMMRRQLHWTDAQVNAYQAGYRAAAGDPPAPAGPGPASRNPAADAPARGVRPLASALEHSIPAPGGTPYGGICSDGVVLSPRIVSPPGDHPQAPGFLPTAAPAVEFSARRRPESSRAKREQPAGARAALAGAGCWAKRRPMWPSTVGAAFPLAIGRPWPDGWPRTVAGRSAAGLARFGHAWPSGTPPSIATSRALQGDEWYSRRDTYRSSALAQPLPGARAGLAGIGRPAGGWAWVHRAGASVGAPGAFPAVCGTPPPTIYSDIGAPSWRAPGAFSALAGLPAACPPTPYGDIRHPLIPAKDRP